jgi:hypothetical protein
VHYHTVTDQSSIIHFIEAGVQEEDVVGAYLREVEHLRDGLAMATQFCFAHGEMTSSGSSGTIRAAAERVGICRGIVARERVSRRTAGIGAGESVGGASGVFTIGLI